MQHSKKKPPNCELSKLAKFTCFDNLIVYLHYEEIEYYQVSWEISNIDTERREFAPLKTVKDNYPKYLLSTESFTQNKAGIIHKNVFEWLLEK